MQSNIETTSKQIALTLTMKFGFLLIPNRRELQATLAEIGNRKQNTTIRMTNTLKKEEEQKHWQ